MEKSNAIVEGGMRSARARGITDYLDALDGFRTLGTLLVLLFHYWQQSWVGFSWAIQLGSYTLRINLEPWIITGGLGVEVLFLLSGFCLYYPLALDPDRQFNAREFAYKRFVRILPSYYLCFLVGALLQLWCTPWAQLRMSQLGPQEWWYHFIGGLFFGQTATPRMYTNPFNGVLWSLPIELQFYLIYPLVLRAFRKRPLLTAACAFVVGECWRFYLRSVDSSNIVFLMNQLPGMIDVFVGGMLAAWMTGHIRRALNSRQLSQLAPVFTALALAFLLFFGLDQLQMYQSRSLAGGTAVSQMVLRKYNIMALGLGLMAAAFACRWLRRVLGNPFTRYISTISYQLYMWHMLIGLRLKEWHIPPYTIPEGGTYPMDDVAWRLPYLLISLALSFAVATAITYLYERPISRALLRHRPAWVISGGSSLRAELIAVLMGVALYAALQAVLACII